MSAMRQALAGGWSRLQEARGLLAGLLLLNMVFAMPAGWAMVSSLHESVKMNRASEALEHGFDMGWYGEYRGKASEMEKTFKPTVVLGVSGFLDNMEAWASGDLWRSYPGLVLGGVLFALLWIFLLGGVLDRFRQQGESFSLARYFQSCGRFAIRFYRLAVLSGVLYFAVYELFRWAYQGVDRMTRDIPSEHVLLFSSLAVVGVTVVLLHLVQIGFTYAKIATVRDARRSMIGAALHGAGFVLSHPLPTLGLALGLGFLSMLWLALYSLLAPGPGGSGWAAVWLAFLLGQFYLGVKMFMRLWLLGSEVALYEYLAPEDGSLSVAHPAPGPAGGEVAPAL